MTYEWDPVKAAANIKKDRVTFEEAAEEDREITIGRSARQRVLFVAHAAREGGVRIISARRATRREQSQYEKRIDEATQ